VYAVISCFLVLFAGIMSGLTLGLMSLGLVELEILQRSGTDAEKAQAGPIQNPIYFPLSTSLCSIWLLLSE
jgi:metal transporter CNNM